MYNWFIQSGEEEIQNKIIFLEAHSCWADLHTAESKKSQTAHFTKAFIWEVLAVSEVNKWYVKKMASCPFHTTDKSVIMRFLRSSIRNKTLNIPGSLCVIQWEY